MKDIQQLIKKNSQEGRYEDIFPKTFIDAVLDKESGVTLTDILAMFNMLFLSYNGSRSQTRLQVPSSLRREGLWVTYVLYDKTVVTEWYSAEAIDDTTFGDSANWRDGSNALVGDISISSDGYWVINGEVTNIKAQGEAGITPILRVGSNNHLQVSYTNGSSYVDVSSNPVFTQFRVSNNKLQQSTDLGESWSNISEELAYKFRESGNKIQMSKDLGNTWEDVSDYIAAWFRFTGTTGSSQADNVGKIQISRDNGATWSDLSGEFTNSLHIKGYVATVGALPSTAVQGNIYGVGPTYDTSDTEHTNPIYQLYVKNSTGWVNNGRFTSIAAGVVQETGDSETEVMSQKAVTEKLSELGSNVGIIASEPRVNFIINADKSINIIFTDNLFAYGIDGEGYNIPSGSYLFEDNKCLIYNIDSQAVEVVSADALKGILLAYNEGGRVLNGMLSKYFTKKRYDDIISSILLNEGNISTKNRVSFVLNDDLSIDIIYVDSVYLFGLDNSGYNVGSKDDKYNIPYNKALVYDVKTSIHSIVSVNKIPENSLLLAYNERGYISNGVYKPFWDEQMRERTNADFNSKINKLSIPNVNIGHYTGYMNNIGVIEETAVGFECLATDWIGVKEGDVILYKGYGYSAGLSWVLKDNNGDYTSGEIDSITAYAEIIVPKNGTIRFSSYRGVESTRVLVLDVLYKDSLESRVRNLENGVINSSKKRINKTMVNVGMSIWWLDSTNYSSSNQIDGEGTKCKGYQTLLQDNFEFDRVVKYAYSGYSLGIGNSAESSIMNTKASTWVAQNNAFWTLDTIVNDFGRNVPLGTVDDYINGTGITTFYGALRAFKNRVDELSPNAVVICSNALLRTDRASDKNSIGLTFEDYEKAMCYVASKEGWYFVDQNRYGGINDVNASYTLYDGLHPTNFGFRVAVKPWIEQISIISF